MGESAGAVKAWRGLCERKAWEVTALLTRLFGLILLGKELTMTVFTVTPKGDITLTKDVLKHLDIHPGDQIDVVERPDGKLELSAVKSRESAPVKGQQPGGLEKFFGSLKNKHNIHLTIDEINEEIKKAWAGER
ncbi:AbrB/MazE/SpoVT family DNA-binding domain-containing protein [Neorhizobium petrolearium]